MTSLLCSVIRNEKHDDQTLWRSRVRQCPPRDRRRQPDGRRTELEVVDLLKGEKSAPDHLAEAPHGLVPILDDHGQIVHEASAINIYLAEKTGSPLSPGAGQRATRPSSGCSGPPRGPLPELTMIEPGEDEDWVSVAGTTLSAISYLPRTPFAQALGVYAVSTTLSRRMHYRNSQFEWLLRANTEDALATERALVDLAAIIGDVDHPEAGKARDLLLEALGALDPAAQPKLPVEYYDWCSPDSTSAEGGLTHWTPAVGARDAGWGEHVLRHSADLVSYAHDPDARLHADSVALLREAFEDVLAHDQDCSFYLQDGLRAVLARWAPDLLARYFGRTDPIILGDRSTTTVMHRLQASWLVHDDRTKRGIQIAFEGSMKAARETGTKLNVDLVVLAREPAISRRPE